MLLDQDRWKIGNIDAMILAEAPKLKEYMPEMAGNISQVLNIAPSDTSIKAGTNERMGFVGRGEGIAAYAVALIESTRREYRFLKDNKSV